MNGELAGPQRAGDRAMDASMLQALGLGPLATPPAPSSSASSASSSGAVQHLGGPGGAQAAAPRQLAAPRSGPVTGRTLARTNPEGAPIFNAAELTAGEPLGAADSESEALALAKTLHRAVAIVPSAGVYLVYAIGGASAVALEPAYVRNAGLRLEAGVLALVNPLGVVYRATDLARATPLTSPSVGASADPLEGYRALAAEQGGVSALSEPELRATFEAALRDTALALLASSEHEARSKTEQLGRAGATSAQEHGEIEAAARQALACERRAQTLDQELGRQRHLRGRDDVGDLSKDTSVRAEKAQVMEAKRRAYQRYPMLRRYQSAEELEAFLGKGHRERELTLRRDGGSVLADLAATRVNVQSGALNLWEVPPVVEATFAGLGLGAGAPQRRTLQAHRRAQRSQDAVRSLALGVFGMALGLGGALLSGGASVALTAGAVGVGGYDAVATTEQFLAADAAAGTDLDPDAGLLPAEARLSFGWLLVAWAGVALDASNVLKATRIVSEVSEVAKGKPIAQAALDLHGGDAKLLQRLRLAAGEAEVGDVISEGLRPGLSARLGAELHIDGTLGRDVQVLYDVLDDGRTAVTHVKAGPAATVGDILVHSETVALLRRRTAVAGRLQQLWDRIRSFAGLGRGAVNPFPPGSVAFESWIELQKHSRLIAYRRALLTEQLGRASSGAPGAGAKVAQQELRQQLHFLEADLDRHQRVVDALAVERGAGAVAMSDATREALAGGHQLPDLPGKTAADVTAEELRTSGYYFERQHDGAFALREKAARLGNLGNEPAYVRALAVSKRLPAKLKQLGQCDAFADALQRELQKAKLHGTRLRIQAGPRTRPYSNTHGTLGGTGSYHDAIEVGDRVFDNLRPSGIAASEFAADLGGYDLLRATGAVITRTPF